MTTIDAAAITVPDTSVWAGWEQSKAGAWADVLLIDGDPTKDINVLKDFERNLVVIIKDGTIHKNTLA